MRYIVEVKHYRTITLSAILFLICCWLTKVFYDNGRNSCSGMLDVFLFFGVYIPVALFALILLCRAFYRFIWRGKEVVELLPVVIIALFIYTVFLIEGIKKLQDNDIWITAVTQSKHTSREAHVRFRNNGTYTVTDRGPCYGCCSTNEYHREDYKVVLNNGKKYSLANVYFAYDAVLKPSDNIYDTARWLYIDVYGNGLNSTLP